jgi:two-component system chemotaxis sensor kinase CheA
MIGVESIVVIAHALETLVRTADRAGGAFGREAVEIALQAVAAISERIRSVAEARVVTAAPERLLEAIASTDAGVDVSISQTAIPPEWETRLSPSERQQLAIALQMKVPVWTVSFIPSEANATRGITITAVRAQLGAIGEIVKVLPRSITATADVRAGVAFDMLIVTTATRVAIAEIASMDPERVLRVLAPASTHADNRVPASLDDHVSPVGRAFVRVELSRLDELQDQLSLLIVSRFVSTARSSRPPRPEPTCAAYVRSHSPRAASFAIYGARSCVRAW